MSIESKSVLIGLLATTILMVGCLLNIEAAYAFDECVKIKYSTVIDRYGIYTGDKRGFDFFLGDRKSIPLGSCYDNNSTINLYRTPAQEKLSQDHQDYLNDYVPVELTAEQRALQLLESLGYKIYKHE